MLVTDDYLALLHKFPPRPIRNDEELEATQEVVNSLLDKPSLTVEERDYLNVLGTLIYDYEQTLDPIIDVHGVELLKFLIEADNLRQKDLVPIFKTESIVSEVLNGKRDLTARHIQELAEFFQISPALFFPLDKKE
ncbi:transcriptional regulator [Pannus brasiliensis CCIBt3594]|uniref:Transcriptional regulator n=1 Tax=Pannus brasiliensis CCIBt3594 TaxID=1427578 RepID=A0AAW9QRT9_9CHRO